jgi:gliding motility-associated-like protein
MCLRSILKQLIVLSVILLFSNTNFAQIYSPNADKIKPIDFPVGNKDTAYIFCAVDEFDFPASLTAKTPMGISSSFKWQKYDETTASFIDFGSVNPNDTLESTISNLQNGLYQVTINGGGVELSYRKWVFNNWIKVTETSLPDSLSNCIEYKVFADTSYASLYYYDINTNERHSLRNPEIKFKFRWYENNELVSSSLNYTGTPKASDTPIKLKLVVIDEFSCQGEGSVDYNSKVPETAFDYDPKGGEAVLSVSFSNNSINWDSVYWFFYKDMNIIKKEAEENEGEVIDSIDFILTDEAPVYEFEKTGEYKIKVVTVKINDTGNCFDTLYMEPGEFIMVDTSLVKLPNVFTPNADGVNDVYVVESRSLKSMTIKIYNRWGGLVHSWSYSNIRSSDYTIEHSVWDGKIGGRMASPGVYFIVVRAVGRDDKERNQNGYIHLFRSKD